MVRNLHQSVENQLFGWRLSPTARCLLFICTYKFHKQGRLNITVTTGFPVISNSPHFGLFGGIMTFSSPLGTGGGAYLLLSYMWEVHLPSTDLASIAVSHSNTATETEPHNSPECRREAAQHSLSCNTIW